MAFEKSIINTTVFKALEKITLDSDVMEETDLIVEQYQGNDAVVQILQLLLKRGLTEKCMHFYKEVFCPSSDLEYETILWLTREYIAKSYLESAGSKSTIDNSDDEINDDIFQSEITLLNDDDKILALDESSNSKLDSFNNYGQYFSDAQEAIDFSVLSDQRQHYFLYGKEQGRAELIKLEQSDSKNVIIISPSHEKECGIGEYGKYLSVCFRKQNYEVTVVRQSSEVLALSADFVSGSLVLINHGPGLFDGLNSRLSQGEPTHKLLQNLEYISDRLKGIPMFIMHSLIDRDQTLLFSRQQLILKSNIPKVVFISSAATHFFVSHIELGVSPVSIPEVEAPTHRENRNEVIGFFGFFQYGGKDFDSLFHLARELRAKLVGSVATVNKGEMKILKRLLKESGIKYKFGSGWVDDTELLARLSEADYFYLPQNDYDHWNNSATARFVTNLARPLFLPPHHPFLDMSDGSIFSSKEDLPRVVAYYRQESVYKKAVARVRKFRERADMLNTADHIMNGLVDTISDTGKKLLVTANQLSFERYCRLPQGSKKKMLERCPTSFVAEDEITLDGMLSGSFFKSVYSYVDPIQYWRKHYEISDLIEGSVFEAVNSIFIRFCKRTIKHEELKNLIDDRKKTGKSLVFLAIKKALDNKSEQFSNTDIYILNGGVPLKEISDKGIISAIENRTAVVNKINVQRDEIKAAKKDLSDNLFVQLSYSKYEYTSWDNCGDIDLSKLSSIFRHDSINDRFISFLSFAGENNINIGEQFILDKPVVPEVDHLKIVYPVDNLLFFEGDYFLLNLIRSFKKRDPFPLELFVLGKHLEKWGVLPLIRYVDSQQCSKGRVLPFKDKDVQLEFFSDCRNFYEVMRDPVAGDVDQRNQYLISSRNNTRWWISMDRERSKLWEDSGQNFESLAQFYYELNAEENLKLYGYDTNESSKDCLVENWLTPHGCLFDKEFIEYPMLTPSSESFFEQVSKKESLVSLEGFYALEQDGVWMRGAEGRASFKLNVVGDETPKLSLTLRGLGASAKNNKVLEIKSYVLGNNMDGISTLSHIIQNDELFNIEVSLDSDIDKATVVILDFHMSEVGSPKSYGLGEDLRTLGLFLSDIELIGSKEIIRESMNFLLPTNVKEEPSGRRNEISVGQWLQNNGLDIDSSDDSIYKLEPGSAISLDKLLDSEGALVNFFERESQHDGFWSKPGGGKILIRLGDLENKQDYLKVSLATIGSSMENKKVTTVRCTVLDGGGEKVLEARNIITNDESYDVYLLLDKSNLSNQLALIEMDVSETKAPVEYGINEDTRKLGVMVMGLGINT